MSNSNRHVSWRLELSIAEGRDADFRNLMNEMVSATQQSEPGTLDYEWYVSDDGRRVHILERYADASAALAHMSTFQERYAERFFGLLKPAGGGLYGAPNATIREAFAPVCGAAMAQAAGFSRRAPVEGSGPTLPDDLRQAQPTA